MDNRKAILIVLAVVVVLSVGVAIFAAVRSRQPAPETGTGVVVSEDQSSSTEPNGELGSSENDVYVVVCGDGICSSDETVESCWSDCVDLGVFGDIRILNQEDGSISVTWQTAQPMTSVVDYGSDESYGDGSVSSESLVTSHSLTVPDLGSGVFYFRLRSSDTSGQEAILGGLSKER